jgi:hypothetical protein
MTERICHPLTAIGITTGTVEREAAVEAERKRKPRRKSQKAMITTAQRAGLPVKKLNPDGSVEIGDKAVEPERSQEVVALEKWRTRHGR